jgi:hypothetical protein
MSTKASKPVLVVKAKISVKHASGSSSAECSTAVGLADEALHCLIQELGTAGAWEFINKKMGNYRADYAGIAGTVQ